jgi:hypothetical protein
VSGYAPVSSAPTAEWDAYYSDLALALSHAKAGDIQLIGTDANAALGCGSVSEGDMPAAVGPYGLTHVNASGRPRVAAQTRRVGATPP